jgi:hypothetical protein
MPDDQSDESSMRDHDRVRSQTTLLARSYLDLLARRKFEDWIELWADDGICEFPFGPASRKLVYEGKDEIYRYMTSFPDKMAIDAIDEMQIHPMLDPERLLAELAIRGRAMPSNRSYDQRYLILVQAKGGKIWRYREYWNPLVSVEAFGGLDSWTRGFGEPKDGSN